MAKARLSSVYQDIRGAVGKEVIFLSNYGLVTRRKPRYKYPVHSDVQAANERLRLAMAAWSSLTLDQVQAWRNYGASVRKVDPVTLKEYTQTARTAFCGLTVKYLQANPVGDIPTLPPNDALIGDAVLLAVAPISGGVRFTAGGPNTPGVTTELLVQKLANIRRLPGKFYKSKAFHAFTSSSLDFDLPLEPGAYAFAYRFVRVATGQATGTSALSVVEVAFFAEEVIAA